MVIYNPISGRGKACKIASAIAAKLLQIPCDVELLQTQITSPEKWLTPKLQCNPDVVIVVGGDGTLRQVASVLINTSIPIYHAACGTENLFAKSMGMVSTPEVVVDAVERRQLQIMDTAVANGKFMVLMASVGFDAGVVADLAEHRGTSITHFSYFMPIVRQLLRWNVPTISVVVDDKEIVSHKKGWVVAANCRAYARGLNPARNANITDGLLDVVFLPFVGRLGLWKWVTLMKRGTHLHHSDVVCAKGKHILISTEDASPWQIDGDSVGDASEMKLSCTPSSLVVLM